MPQIIKGSCVVNDNWQFIARDHEGSLPSEACMVHVAAWLALDENSKAQTAPWIDADDNVETFADQLLNASLIAVHFPTFMDGRGFSSARLLRDRFGYSGELRAIGNVTQDQLFFLKRCGFDSYDLREGTDLEAALKSLSDFDVTYQAAADVSTPLFRRRKA